MQSRDDSPLLYQEDVEVADMNHFENAEKVGQMQQQKIKYKRGSAGNYHEANIDDENMNNSEQQNRQAPSYKN